MLSNKINRFHLFILIWIGLLSVAQGQVSIQFDQADPSEDLVAGKLAQFSIYAQPTVVALAEIALYADGEKLVEAVQVASDRWIASGIFFDRAGPWDLQVIAIDENGQEWRSGIESFEVVYAPPEVRILAPLDGFQHPVGTLLPVQLAAFDPFGLITHVELWLNGQLIVTHEWSENNFSWKVEVPNPLPNEIFAGDKPLRSNIQLISAGTYVLEARAYSTTGLSAFSERALIEVDDPELSPVMNLISPADGSQFLPGTTVPVQVEGWDPGGLIEHVEFLMNGVVVDSLEAPPFRTNVQLPSTGQYRLQARATTSFGQFSYSQEIVLQAGPPDGVTPRVIINFPLPLGAGDTVNDVSQASDMYFNAEVTDPDGGQIEDVQFYLNGQLLGGAESQLGNTYARYYAPNSIGNYVITASAIDDSGRLGWSLPVALDVGPLERQLPQASISRDVTEAIVGREVTLRAIADGGLIPVDRVDFLIDGVFIGSVAEVDADGLYSLDWVPNEAGDFRLEARVVQIDPEDSPWDNWYITDPAVLTVSEPVGQLPSVYMDVYPVQANLTIGSVLMVWAQAYDPEGDIQRVEFYGEDEFLGVVDGAPFAFPYTIERSGRHTLYSRVIDADGNAVSSNTIELDVSPRVVPVGPRLDLELPESVRTGEPAQFAISLSGTVLVPEAVYFFANGQLVGSSSEAPYVFDWIPSTTGQVRFFASASFAFPDGSVFALSSPIEERNVILGGGAVEQDMPPVIERFYTDLPGDFARLGQTLVWEVGASDDDGLVSIEVFRNGEPLPSNSSLPIEVTDTIADMGIYRYFVRVRDTGGNITESAVRELTATRGSTPEVYFASTDLLTIYGDGAALPVEVLALAGQEQANIPEGSVQIVEFYLNGELIGTDSSAPYEVVIEPSDAVNGINILRAIAESDTGLRTESEPLQIERKESVLEDSTPPVIEKFKVDLPGNLARLGQTLVWEIEASDDKGLASIQVFRNGELLPAGTRLPTEVTDTITDMGIYRYFVRVRDIEGNITESAVREIAATRGSAPLVYFALADSLTLYEESEPIKIEVQAVSPDEPSLIAGGKIELVEFYLNGELIGTDSIAPYEVTVEPADASLGTNQLYAIAESDTGLRSQSMSREIELKEGKLPVINSFSLSPDAEVYLPGTPLQVEVVVENTDTTVGVELLLFGQPIENIKTPPYRFHFASETVGNYSVQARVTNVYGHSLASDELNFSIVYPDPVSIERDFVYQTFIDLLFRIPSKEELDGYEVSLLSGSLTRERFVAGLLGAGESNGHSEEYANIRTALLGWAFARSDWPQRGELKTVLEEVRTGGLSTVVARQMPAYAAAYAEDTGLVLPSQLSSDIEIEIFVGWLFSEKYGFEPDAEQLRLAVFHFLAMGRDAFVTEFISDNTVIALPEGWATARLGFFFSSKLPPVNDILQRVDAASLLINLLRVEALPSEVNSLVLELPVSQVASIISDSRYAARFVSTFEEIEVHHEGWLRSDWFGWFNPDFEPWVFHNEQGWLRLNTTGQSENSLWYYDPSFGWIWTQSHVYPYLFDASGNRWLWTWRKPYRSGERLFFDLNTQKWLFK